MFRIDVRENRQMQAVLLAIRGASNEIARQYRQRLKPLADEAWSEELRGNVQTKLQARMLETARTRVSDQNVKLSVASVGRPLSKRTGGAGAAKPATVVRLVEFGGSPKYSKYKRRSVDADRRTVGRHDVNRRTMTGYGPRAPKGNMVYPALARTVPRVAALMVQTCYRTLADAFEGKR